MTNLEDWLKQAVRHLSKDSSDTVRREIREHYDAELEHALREGANPQLAEVFALQALGDPRAANRQYRKVLLSASEAALLRRSNREARMICSGGWLKWVLLAAPGTVLLLSAIFLALHKVEVARSLLALGAMMAFFFVAPFLPIYTPLRARVFRLIKWALMIVGVVVLFGDKTLQWSWLLSCCFFPVFQIEWKRMMIRRKLPMGQWPRQLYL